jgi:hypothetical protein
MDCPRLVRNRVECRTGDEFSDEVYDMMADGGFPMHELRRGGGYHKTTVGHKLHLNSGPARKIQRCLVNDRTLALPRYAW